MTNIQEQLEAQINAATKALAELPPDDPRAIEVLQIRSDLRARQVEDARREAWTDVADDELEGRLLELTDDAGELEIARAELDDAKRQFPDRVSLAAGQATAP
jgi:hypothetical protein